MVRGVGLFPIFAANERDYVDIIEALIYKRVLLLS
jgi:hypothetical protein